MTVEKEKIRLTRQRRVIMESLRRVKTHPTADEVYDMVREHLPKISLSSVYRNLEVMADCGMIQKIDVVGTQKRFDGNPSPHYHIRCVGCGRVDDIEIPLLPHIDEEAEKVSSYRVLGHHIEFSGICADCRTDSQ